MQYLIIIIALFVLELLYFKIADKYNIIDKPNERSSHTQITLRGGGVIFYIGALLYFIVSGFEYPYFFLGLTLITLISFLDDILTLSNKLRLLIQLVSMILMFYQVGMFEMAWWIVPIALIVSVGTINAYNFMDGINGITVSNSLAVLVLLAIANQNTPFINSEFLYYIILSVIVFGFFNFRNKAKAFAGDVGSVAIAFIILFLLAKLIITTQNVIYILFLLIYGLDAVWTIIRRLFRKENIFEAHRSHLYQFYANENKTNRLIIAAIYGVLQLLVGLFVLYTSSLSLEYQIILSILLLILGSSSYLFLKSRLIRKHQIV